MQAQVDSFARRWVMFGRNGGKVGSVKRSVAGAADAAAAYVDPLIKDEKLRKRLVAAGTAAAAAKRRARRQAGLTGLARRLATDQVLRAQLSELGAQLKGAQRRAKKTRSHKLRNTLLILGGAAVAAAAASKARKAFGGDDHLDDGPYTPPAANPSTPE
jgi:hypothetical protein